MDKEFKKIDEGYKKLQQTYEKSKTFSEELARNLLKLQAVFDSGGIEEIEEEEFLEFQNRLDSGVIQEIIRKVKGKKNRTVTFSAIKGSMRKSYPSLTEKSIRFLSTAEYLFLSLNKEKIDFAPIMVEYCKVIENEFIEILYHIGFIQKKFF